MSDFLHGMVVVSIQGGRVNLAHAESVKEAFAHELCHFFDTDEEIVYIPFCDDFGPMNFADMFHFVGLIEQKLAQYPGHKIVYKSLAIRRAPRSESERCRE